MLREQGEEFLHTSHSPGPKIHSYKRSGPRLTPELGSGSGISFL